MPPSEACSFSLLALHAQALFLGQALGPALELLVERFSR
jgi:hypothetical protein